MRKLQDFLHHRAISRHVIVKPSNDRFGVFKKKGDQVGYLNNKQDRDAYAIIQAENEEKCIQIASSIQSYINVSYEKLEEDNHES